MSGKDISNSDELGSAFGLYSLIAGHAGGRLPAPAKTSQVCQHFDENVLRYVPRHRSSPHSVLPQCCACFVVVPVPTALYRPRRW